MRDPVTDYDRHDSIWNVVAGSSGQADVFCCRTEWQLSFHETFDGMCDRPLIVREHDGSVMAFAERSESPMGPLLEPVESSWCFGSPLLGPLAVDLLVEVVQERVAVGLRESVLVSGLHADASTKDQLVEAFHPHFQFYGGEPTALVHASLQGGIDGYLSRRSGGWRRNVRAQSRRAREQGVEFERSAPESHAEADAIYDRILDVEQRSWKGIGRCGMAEEPSRSFYRVMLRRMSDASIGRVIFARHEGRDIGFVFGGIAGDTYRGQQFSFVEEWRRASIGNLLQLEQLHWLCEEGIAHYDMGPLMDYKRHWTERETSIECWLLRPA